MAGIYIHIPFCRQACRYCDFYFTVSLKYRDEYGSALIEELSLRKNYLFDKKVSTIYIGGGTPSVLEERHIHQLLKSIHANYSISEHPEITIEANPDDLTKEYLQMLKRSGFNRLSIGIQSFSESDLELMRRSHTAEQAVECLDNAQGIGFSNINIDLIYGLPDMTMHSWEKNVLLALEMPVQHISAYHLTFEPDTVFYHWKKRGKLVELPEEDSIGQYQLLRSLTGEKAFEHYEISNFALAGYRSAHNSSYWKGDTYAGYGPSAHSYNGAERQWNIASLKKYTEKVNKKELFFEKEVLTHTDKYHDYLLTALRTVEGADLIYIYRTFGDAIYHRLLQLSQEFVKAKDMEYEKEILRMTPAGWLKSDLIIGKLMLLTEKE